MSNHVKNYHTQPQQATTPRTLLATWAQGGGEGAGPGAQADRPGGHQAQGGQGLLYLYLYLYLGSIG